MASLSRWSALLWPKISHRSKMPGETMLYLFELIHEMHGVGHALIVRVMQSLRQDLVHDPIVAFEPLASDDCLRR